MNGWLLRWLSGGAIAVVSLCGCCWIVSLMYADKGNYVQINEALMDGLA